MRSPFGHVLVAIRENENRTAMLGYDVARYKLIAFVLSGGFAGFAGAAYVLTPEVTNIFEADKTNRLIFLVIRIRKEDG